MTEKRFRAFISYSQQDKEWGARLHRWLESYRVPVGLLVEVGADRRLGRFFRDDEEMPAAADIAGVVRRAIEDSESLIVICSPRAAQSKWVAAEIAHFRQTGRGSKVFAFIVDGQPNSGDSATECFPPALRAKAGDHEDELPIEPVGIDVRKDGRERSCARLAAGLLGIDFDELWQRERRRAAQKQRRLIGALSATSVVFASLAALAVYFGSKSNENAKRAEKARIELLTDSSERLLATGDHAKAIAYASAALGIAQKNEVRDSALNRAERASRQALHSYLTSDSRLVASFRGHSGRVADAVLSNDKKVVVTGGDEGAVRLYEADTGKLRWEQRLPAPIVNLFFIDQDRHVVITARDGTLETRRVDGKGQPIRATLGVRLRGARPVKNGDEFVAWGFSGTVGFWQPLSGQIERLQLKRKIPVLNVAPIADDADLLFADQGTLASVVSLDSRSVVHEFTGIVAAKDLAQGQLATDAAEAVNVIDMRSGAVRCSVKASVVHASFASQAHRLAVYGVPRSITIWSLPTCAKVATHVPEHAIKSLLTSSEADALVAWGSDGASIFRLSDGQPKFSLKPGFPIVGGAVSGERLLLYGANGDARVWSLKDGALQKSIETPSAIRRATLSKSSRTVWITYESGELRVSPVEADALNASYFHDDLVLGWRETPDSTAMLTWAADGTTKLWSYLSAHSDFISEPVRLADSLVTVNEGAKVGLAARPGDVFAWHLETGKQLAHLTGGGLVQHLASTRDGSAALILLNRGACAWHLQTGTMKCSDFEGNAGGGTVGKSLLFIHERDANKIYLIDTANLEAGFVEAATGFADFVTIDDSLVSCARNGAIDVFSDASGKPRERFDLKAEILACTALAKPRRLAVTLETGELVVLDFNDGMARIEGEWRAPVKLPLSELNRFNQIRAHQAILFAGDSGRFLWLDPDTRQVVRDETGSAPLGRVVPSLDGQYVAAITRGLTAVAIYRRSGPPAMLTHKANVVGLHFLEARNELATWAADRSFSVWNAATGKLVRDLPHAGIVQGVATTPDGMLVTWTDGNDLTFWDMGAGTIAFRTRLAHKVRSASFRASPDRMTVQFERAAPITYRYTPKNKLAMEMSERVAILNPMAEREACLLSGAQGTCSSDRPHRGVSSRMSDDDFLKGVHVGVELGQLHDGGLLIVCDRPLPKILAGVEYNEFDQLLTLFAVDGTTATMAIPIPFEIFREMRNSDQIIVYSLFPGQEPVGYRVPLMPM